MEFRKLGDNQQADLILAIQDFVQSVSEPIILLGCDSQNSKKQTVFAVVVGLYTKGSGASVLYKKITVPKIRDTFTRLFREGQEALEVAEYILNNTGIRVDFIDIDINNDPKYKSNQALSSTVGLLTGMGYKVRTKNKNPMMTYAADNLVK